MIKVISCGVLHDEVPHGHIVVDLTTALVDPYLTPALRALTGLHRDVRGRVLCQPGAEALALQVAFAASALAETVPDPVVVVYCLGGRHRSVVIANRVVEHLRDLGYVASATHRDLTKPVVVRVAAEVTQ